MLFKFSTADGRVVVANTRELSHVYQKEGTKWLLVMANGDRFKVPADTAENLWAAFTGRCAGAKLDAIRDELNNIGYRLAFIK